MGKSTHSAFLAINSLTKLVAPRTFALFFSPPLPDFGTASGFSFFASGISPHFANSRSHFPRACGGMKAGFLLGSAGAAFLFGAGAALVVCLMGRLDAPLL